MLLDSPQETFSPQLQPCKADKKRIPKHVSIIMDGNRRWARKKRLPHLVGHWKGADVLSTIVRAASGLGIEILTVYAFSTENWSRSPIEIEGLMRLFKIYLKRKRASMVQEGVKLSVIGDLSKLPNDLYHTIQETMQLTATGDKIELVLAVNYGGRDEIRRAVQKILTDFDRGKLQMEMLTEETISSYLDSSGRPDPDLIIRTSGESRLSNFLLWQASYSEVVVSPVLWPDFKPEDLLNCILEYQRRELRRGR